MSSSFMASDARAVALQALQLTDKNYPVQAAMEHALSRCSLSPQDKNLVTELVYGTLRARILLDANLALYLDKPAKLPSAVLHVLAMGLYSLFFANRIPPHAAIDCAVRVARHISGQRLANLVNAVLRKAQARGLARHFYNNSSQPEVWHNLSINHAMPPAIVAQWRNAFGDGDTLRLLRRSFARPWTGLRINASHPAAAKLCEAFSRIPSSAPLGAWGVAFPPGVVPATLSGKSLQAWHEEGALSYQAAGSQILMERLGLYAWRKPVWDCCCGVGGKSLALLERSVPLALCSDISRERLRHLPRDCARLGLLAPPSALADATCLPLGEAFSGHILLDAPCSSLGVLARRPDVKKKVVDDSVLNSFALSQKKLLDTVAGVLKPGRQLAYMTCTLNPAENESQISAFLERHSDFSLERAWVTPHEHPWMEGMYGALLLRH